MSKDRIFTSSGTGDLYPKRWAIYAYTQVRGLRTIDEEVEDSLRNSLQQSESSLTFDESLRFDTVDNVRQYLSIDVIS